MYTAQHELLERAQKLARHVRADLDELGVTGFELNDRAIEMLERSLEIELAMWLRPTPHDELDDITSQLAATWIVIGMIQFSTMAALLRGQMADMHQDFGAHWEEHIHQVAVTIARTSGDWRAAQEYMELATEEWLRDPNAPF